MRSNSSGHCILRYNVEILNRFDPKLQLINTKPITKNKLKELLSELKKFKVHTVLVLDYDLIITISKELIVKTSIQLLN